MISDNAILYSLPLMISFRVLRAPTLISVSACCLLRLFDDFLRYRPPTCVAYESLYILLLPREPAYSHLTCESVLADGPVSSITSTSTAWISKKTVNQT